MRLLAVLLWLSVSSFAADPWVVSRTGNWKTAANVQISSAVAAGSEMFGTANTAIALMCESALVTYTCLKNECRVKACERPPDDGTTLVRVVAQHSWIAAAMKALFSREPRYQVLGTRGAGLLPDTILKQENGQLFLGPALARLRDGPLCFILGELPAGSGRVRSFELEWDSEDPVKQKGIVPLGDLHPGTYTLQWGIPEGGMCRSDEAAASPAWVLVAVDRDFEQVNNQWKLLLKDVERIGDETNPETEKSLRHALLAYLADSLRLGQ